jgi:hypothetical protein
MIGFALYMRHFPNNSGIAGYAFLRHDEWNYLPLVIGFLNGQWDVDYFINPTFYMYILYAATVACGWFAVLIDKFETFADFSLQVTLNPSLIVEIGRYLSILVSAASVGLLFWIGRRIFSTRVAFAASLALALDMTHCRRAVLMGNESMMLFFVLLFFVCLLVYRRAPGTGKHVLCGVLLGLAGSIKYNAFIQVIPFVVVTLQAAYAEQRYRDISERARWLNALANAAFRPRFIAGYLVMIAAFFAGSPCILLNFGAFVDGFFNQYSFLHGGFTSLDRLADTVGFLYYLENFGVMNSGIVFSLYCLAGILFMIGLAIIKRDGWCIVILSAALPLYLFLGMGIFSRMRFLLPAIPFILLSGAWFFSGFIDILAKGPAKLGVSETSRWDAFFIYLLFPILLYSTFLCAYPRNYREMDQEFGRIDPRRDIMLWLRENIAPEDKVLEFTHTSYTEFPFSKRVLEWYDYDPTWFKGEKKQKAWQIFKNGLHDFTSLKDLLASSKTLADLIYHIEEGEYRYLLFTLPTEYIVRIAELPKAAPRIIADCPYWEEFIEFVSQQMRAAKVMRSEDGTQSMLLYEVPWHED